MVNAENLRVGAERAGEQDLRQRFDAIAKEIQEAGQNQIEIKSDQLNGQFAEYLLKNPEIFKKLKDDVKRLTPARAGRGLEPLATFLDDIDNPDRMKKDFDEFMKKIENPRKLNTIKSWEIRRINLYIGMHTDEALKAYTAMKPICGKYEENKMKAEDVKFFESVWETLKNNYKNSEDFMYADYPKLKDLAATVSSLKGICGDGRDGSDEKITIEKVENSIIDPEVVKQKVKNKNKERFDKNKGLVEGISLINKVDDKANFIKGKDGELYYRANQTAEKSKFTVENMKNLYGNKINEMVNGLQGLEFVNEEEKKKMIESSYDAIFNKLKTDLLADNNIQSEQTPPENPNSSPENQTSSTEYLANKDIIKIRDQALKTKITSDPKFCESLDGDVKFNMTEVTKYIDGLKDKPWKELKKLRGVDRKTWVISVQIALMHLNSQEGGKYKGKCNVTWLDGIRKEKTIAGIKGFQEAWNAEHKDNTLKVDGAPGPKTMAAILEALGGAGTTTTNTATPATAGETTPATATPATAGETTPAATETTPAGTTTTNTATT